MLGAEDTAVNTTPGPELRAGGGGRCSSGVGHGRENKISVNGNSCVSSERECVHVCMCTCEQ